MTRASDSRLERRRRDTAEQIRATARLLLTRDGAAAVTVNAVAREMGMSGPAVYHYFAGRDDLIEAVIADFYRELIDTLEAARDGAEARPATEERPATEGQPPTERPADGRPTEGRGATKRRVGDRLLATCRALRGWALEHPDEFGWMFASPVTPPSNRTDSPRLHAGQQLERVFLDTITELWTSASLPTPAASELDPRLREQARAYATSIGSELPPEAMHTFLSSWIRLYGLVCMEVMGQLDFAYPEPEAVFEQGLRELCSTYDLDYRPNDPHAP